jgi:hypothetical protein
MSEWVPPECQQAYDAWQAAEAAIGDAKGAKVVKVIKISDKKDVEITKPDLAGVRKAEANRDARRATYEECYIQHPPPPPPPPPAGADITLEDERLVVDGRLAGKDDRLEVEGTLAPGRVDAAGDVTSQVVRAADVVAAKADITELWAHRLITTSIDIEGSVTAETVSVEGNGIDSVGHGGAAVRGTSDSGPGLEGVSAAGSGVRGIRGDPERLLIENGHPVFEHGVPKKAFAFPSSAGGVLGWSDAGPGVHGVSEQPDGAGILGEAKAGPGVHGTSGSAEGLHGESGSGAGVRGSSGSGPGVQGHSASAAGVTGLRGALPTGPVLENGHPVFDEHGAPKMAPSLPEPESGVFGYSDAGPGVHGAGNGSASAGILGQASTGSGVCGKSESGDGVFGQSAGIGVRGQSQGGADGVLGESEGVGVRGRSTGTGAGVLGEGRTGPGVLGVGHGAPGVRAESAGGTALDVSGRFAFSRCGWVVIAAGQQAASVPADLNAATMVLAVVQEGGNEWVQGAWGQQAATSSVEIRLNQPATKSCAVAWFLVEAPTPHPYFHPVEPPTGGDAPLPDA